MTDVNILIRNVDAGLSARIDAAAVGQRRSKQELLHDLLTRSFPAPAVAAEWDERDE